MRWSVEKINSSAVQFLLAIVLMACVVAVVRADDGYRLWLRYDKLAKKSLALDEPHVKSLMVTGDSPTLCFARDELSNGIRGLLGRDFPQTNRLDDGTLLVGTPKTSPVIAGLRSVLHLDSLGDEGFAIRSTVLNGKKAIVIASVGQIGALYGSFYFLRLLETEQPITSLNVAQKPKLQLRILDHWDNLDGSIERGYAGKSLWKWSELPEKVDPRLQDYARANASIGINGAVLNNVNANAIFLTREYLSKVAAIADVFRPYGIRVYLSPRFSAPIELGGLKTADPLDPGVAEWWKKKADEIYSLIPDFGGFLVKANSEGQPGPRTYGRDHVDGANMMASALAPHHGVVIWRAFVYDMKPGYDRAGAAYENLKPFDGKFAANVLLQVKNGPIDLQPREPVHPLFGAMPHTQMMPEFQITQEYLGFSNHLVFLAHMWREVLDADTYVKGKGSTVARVVDGSLCHQKITGIAGVANTGTDRNWTGHDFLQANWYAFGRLAWDPFVSSESIANEWIKMTFTRDAAAVAVIAQIMLGSHDALVDYMTPLGLHHQMWGGHHYGPAPWWHTFDRDDWNPTYYNKADASGIGFDRTRMGSGTVNQYAPPVAAMFSKLNTCPDSFLLWFHHLSWNYRMRSGRTLWDELALHYQLGADWASSSRKRWQSLSDVIDAERFAAIDRKLAIQVRDAARWKDASLAYFGSLSGLSLPAGVNKPDKGLEFYEKTDLLDDFARGEGTFDENH